MSQTASQALARKWRPRDFESLVGQEHVVKALSHALQTQRLHHAYLLTGTRGVGKTTIARILAKAVNCEKGISANPCGQCRACTEIAQGRFVDLLEVDAATNTKVEEMRQLLENAVYAPTAGRYKVYVIDEVHMLSNSSFNAMLKTLEEPPGHILFILATTDPQKIPPTVLSRCLQFGLRQLAPDQIASHLTGILEQESVQFEPGALRIIAKAARGSLRDALSLTDQSIAFAAGNLTETSVRQMLGSVDQQVIVQILQLLAQRDGGGLTALSDSLATQSAPFGALLDELAAASYRLSVASLTGGLKSDDPDELALASLQGEFQPDDLQLFYQIATHARSELHLAPEEHIGFGMALIRMMCFRPGGTSQLANPGAGQGPAGHGFASEQRPPSQVTATGRPSGSAPSGGPVAAVNSAGQASPQQPAVKQSEPDRSQASISTRSTEPAGNPTSALSSSLEAKTRAMMNATQALLAIRQKTGGSSAPEAGKRAPEQPVGRSSPSVQSPVAPPPVERVASPQQMTTQPKPAGAGDMKEPHSGPSASNEASVDVGSAPWDEPPPWDDAPPLGDLPAAAKVTHSDAQLADSGSSYSGAVDRSASFERESNGGHEPVDGTRVAPVEDLTNEPVGVANESEAIDQGSAPLAVPDNSQFGSIADLPGPDDWPALSQAIAATGLVRQALVQTELVGWQDQNGIPCARLITQIKTWLNPGMPEKIEQAVATHLGRPVRLDIQLGDVSKTASLTMQEVRRHAQEQARQCLESDPFLKELQSTMGARIVEGSLRPLHSHGPADV